jgi:hypothetical protein
MNPGRRIMFGPTRGYAQARASARLAWRYGVGMETIRLHARCKSRVVPGTKSASDARAGVTIRHRWGDTTAIADDSGILSRSPRSTTYLGSPIQTTSSSRSAPMVPSAPSISGHLNIQPSCTSLQALDPWRGYPSPPLHNTTSPHLEWTRRARSCWT